MHDAAVLAPVGEEQATTMILGVVAASVRLSKSAHRADHQGWTKQAVGRTCGIDHGVALRAIGGLASSTRTAW